MLKKILYYIVSYIHFLAVLFVIAAPLSNSPGILILNTTYTMSLMAHWYFNSNICCLTLVESQLLNKKTSDTFMHQLVAPIYDGFTEPFLSNVSWVITIISFVVSVYKFFTITKIKSLSDISLKKVFKI